MTKKDWLKIISSLVFLIFGLFVFVATSISAKSVTIKNPLIYNTFWELINHLINLAFFIAVGVAPLMIIVSGFFFISSGGEPEKVQKAKKMIMWTLIGFAIVVCAKALIVFLGQILGIRMNIPSGGP